MYIARMIFWEQELGGRYIPPQSGFKPQIKIGAVHTSCFVYSNEGVEIFELGKAFMVRIELMYPDVYGGQLKIGDKIELYEGNKQIGEGEILDLL